MTRHEVFARDVGPAFTAQHGDGGSADPGPRSFVRAPVRVGFALVLLFLLVFVVWGSFVELAGGTVARGVIAPEGSRKTVQHLEGGIISKLLVRDGDVVKAAQPLLVLEDAGARAAYNVLLSQQRTLLATQSRLEAERMDKANPEFPAELQGNDPELRAATEGQVQIFGARRELHNAHRRELEQRVEQLGEQIKGHEAEVESASRQLDLIVQEIEAKMELEKKGLIPLPTLLALQRLQAEISGQRGQYLATIAQTKQIGETQLQLQSLDSERADQIATELSKTRVELANVSERMLASKDVLARTVITAPVSGTVVNMRFKTSANAIAMVHSARDGRTRHDIAKCGYEPTWVRLHYPDTPEGRGQLAAHCQSLQGQMLAWAANNGEFPKIGYDGSIKSLAHHYQSDELSPYRRLKWNSQAMQDKNIKIVVATVGDRQLCNLVGPDFLRWHSQWGSEGPLLAGEALH